MPTVGLLSSFKFKRIWGGDLYAPRLNPGRKGKGSVPVIARPQDGDHPWGIKGTPLPTQPTQCCWGDLVLSELGATAVISSGCSTEH